jgi:hypothetical protein
MADIPRRVRVELLHTMTKSDIRVLLTMVITSIVLIVSSVALFARDKLVLRRAEQVAYG